MRVLHIDADYRAIVLLEQDDAERLGYPNGLDVGKSYPVPDIMPEKRRLQRAYQELGKVLEDGVPL